MVEPRRAMSAEPELVKPQRASASLFSRAHSAGKNSRPERDKEVLSDQLLNDGFGRSKSAASYWKSSAAPASSEELEALLEDDSEEDVLFEAAVSLSAEMIPILFAPYDLPSTLTRTTDQLDKNIRSKDLATTSFDWAKSTLPPTLALFITKADEPYTITIANKK